MSSSGGRSILATVVGWLIVALIVWFLFGGIFGAIKFVIRMIVFLFVIGALATLYFRLRDGD